MKRKNTTRNALVTSIISMLLCVSMLVGTTFAWFTDEVVTGMNTIAAGNLDVELLADGNKVDSNTKLFDDVTLWEPGVVVYENLQVANVGTLALKYQMTLNFGNENDLNGHKLSEVLKVAVIDKVAEGTERTAVLEAARAAVEASQGNGALSNFYLTGELEAGVSSDEKAVVIFWDANDNATDNLYNANNGQTTSDGKPLHIEFGVNLQATQKMSEEDSFGNDYDEFASILPKATVNNTGAQTVPVYMGINATELALDTSFQFLPNETQDEAESSEYKYWHADYVISADKDVPADSMALAGYYEAWCGDNGWVVLSNEGEAITAGTEIRLVEMLGATVNYSEICQYGNDDIGFLCGAADLTGENAGTTITVELRLYETTIDPSNPSGTANEEVLDENGKPVYKVIGKYSYTFGATTADGLQAALDAGNPEIKLDADIDLSDVTLNVAGNTVIDLNGHTLSGISNSSTTSSLINVAKDAELTLTGNGLVTFEAANPDVDWNPEGFPTYANNTIRCAGKLIIDGITIKNTTNPGGASYAIDCYPGANLVINSGVVDGQGKTAIRLFANSTTVSTNVTINGGTITGSRPIWIHLPGSNAAQQPPVNVTISGGTLTSTADPASNKYLAIYSYSYGQNASGVNITISGGTFNGNVAFGGGSKVGAENVTVTGGTFNGTLGRYVEDDGTNNGWVDIAKP